MIEKNIKRYIRIPSTLSKKIDCRYKEKGFQFKGDYIVDLIANGMIKEDEDYKLHEAISELRFLISELNKNIKESIKNLE